MTDSDDPARPHYSPEELAQAVATIPRLAREVFLLNRSDGLSYTEIAGHLGISEARLIRLMTKALTAMRHALARIERRRR